MANGEATNGEMMEILEFIKDNMATKDELDLKLARYATKEDLERLDQKIEKELFGFKSEILTAVDQFAKKHETLEIEQLSTRNRFDRIEDRVGVVEEKLGLATT